MAQVYLPSALVRLFEGSPRTLAVEAACVRDLVGHLDARWPGMRDRLCTSDGAIRQHVNVFVDGERARPDTALRPGTVVHIIPAISGG
jgi:molybdopterin converting factor small subunit